MTHKCCWLRQTEDFEAGIRFVAYPIDSSPGGRASGQKQEARHHEKETRDG